MPVVCFEVEPTKANYVATRFRKLQSTRGVRNVIAPGTGVFTTTTVYLDTSMRVQQVSRWLDANPLVKQYVLSAPEIYTSLTPTGEHPCTQNENVQHSTKPE